MRKLIVTHVYAAAYKVRGKEDKCLTHATWSDPWKPLCGKVKPEHIMEDEQVWEQGPPTCPACLKRWEKLKNEV